MKISIIIPVYNTAQYLEECLDSIIGQQFKSWECLLIDDGSTDNSANICDLYARRNKRFKAFHTANSGVSFARNLGIKYAVGTYIAFVDSDDTIGPEYLAGLYNAMIKEQAELVICGMKLIRPSGIEINNAPEGLITMGEKDSDRFVELNRKFLLYGPVVKLYCSDIIRNNNIRFPLGVQYGEDLIFNLEYLEYVNNISVIASSGYNYRILSTGSLSSSIHSRNIDNNYRQWKMICSFFQRKGINNSNAQLYLSDRLWGIAYDLVMNSKLSVKEIRSALSAELVKDLKIFDKYTIEIPYWLKITIAKRLHRLMWLIQRRA